MPKKRESHGPGPSWAEAEPEWMQDAGREDGLAEAPAPFTFGAAAVRRLSTDAADLIVQYESGGRAYYDNVIKARPIWPGFASGLTIGFGWDLGHNDEAALRRAWTSPLGRAEVDRLAVAVGLAATEPGREGKVARLKQLVRDLADIRIPWEMAEQVFEAETVPVWCARVQAALPNADTLPDDCFGALVSLAFNRGASFAKTGDRYREMRAIRAHMQARAFDRIPAEIRAMKRLWPNHQGLQQRREDEAMLFEQGLAAGTAPRVAAAERAEPAAAPARATLPTLDAAPDRVDLRDLPYRAPLVCLPDRWPGLETIQKYLPAYEADGMLLDQMSEGACTGFGLAAVINYLYWSRWQLGGADPAEKPKPVSPRMLYHMAQIYDEWAGEDYEGSSCRGAMKGWHKHGVCIEELWPYADGKFVPPEKGWELDAAEHPLGAYYRIDKGSIVDMQAAIREVGAIYCSASVHQGWQRVATSKDKLPVIEPSTKPIGGHAFALVGYKREGFIVQNSWGPDWGFHGFAVLRYDDWLANGFDAWAVVTGAPIERPGASPDTTARQPLQATVRERRLTSGARAAASTRQADAADPTIPWDEATARRHTIVLGNNGRPLHRLIDTADAAATVTDIVRNRAANALADIGTGKLLVYAHGGLNSEDDAVQRVRVLGPWFGANGIHPIFIAWRTGFLETLRSQLADLFGTLQPGLDRLAGRNRLDEFRNWLEEVKDNSLEVAVQGTLIGRGVWREMKENAARAAEPRSGLDLVVEALEGLAGDVNGLEIHLIGHSAGANLQAHLLDRMGAAGLTAASLELWAPACTLAFATERFGAAFQAGTVTPAQTAIHALSDENERADTVGPYGKSLLYLVSRALEDAHRMPLLGLARAWGEEGYTNGEISAQRKADLDAWRTVWGNAAPTVMAKPEVRTSTTRTVRPAHGCFDNDIDVVTAAIERILGRTPAHPVTSLVGF